MITSSTTGKPATDAPGMGAFIATRAMAMVPLVAVAVMVPVKRVVRNAMRQAGSAGRNFVAPVVDRGYMLDSAAAAATVAAVMHIDARAVTPAERSTATDAEGRARSTVANATEAGSPATFATARVTSPMSGISTFTWKRRSHTTGLAANPGCTNISRQQ